MSLLKQFDDWIGNLNNAYEDNARLKARLILEAGLDIFRGIVPIDTEQLKMNIKGNTFETAEGIEIRIWIENRDLSYQKGNRINAIVLGMILEKGKRGGTILKRSKNQELESQGSPTADWFVKGRALWTTKANEILG